MAISDEEINKKLDKYFAMTEQAIELVKLPDFKNKDAQDFLSMARNYLSDAKHFREKGDLLTALAAASYAHAWLDAGVRAGVFDAGKDDKLFTLP